MSCRDDWKSELDGCISVGNEVGNLTYHSALNVLLVTTNESVIKVFDVSSGHVLHSALQTGKKGTDLQCHYLSLRDAVMITDGHAIGIRRDLNGVLFLDTALQTAVDKSEDVICLEILLPEAIHLFNCLTNPVNVMELQDVENMPAVVEQLDKGIKKSKQLAQKDPKSAKWTTVCLQLPHGVLSKVCNNIMRELKRVDHSVPSLPIVSAISERLMYLLPSTLPDLTIVPPDRTYMYSEAARRLTFTRWPHSVYKWAGAEAMAQAGFYHQPTTADDDRAMCFTCNVCLVCWEPTDEPWSEHERHSPSCPFVKGEYTANVPMSVTYATEPALYHGRSSDQIECWSTTTSDSYLATSTASGNVVIWDYSSQFKRHCSFNIDPSFVMVAQLLQSQENLVSNFDSESCSCDDNQAIIITDMNDLGATNGYSTVPPVSLVEDILGDELSHRRPSDNIHVTALSVLGSPKNITSSCVGEGVDKIRPCLVCGVGLGLVGEDSKQSLEDFVLTQNQVNQARSAEDGYNDMPSALCGSDIEKKSKLLKPHLLVYGICERMVRDSAFENQKTNLDVGQSVVSNKPYVTFPQDYYVSGDDDDDVQIIEMTSNTNMPQSNNKVVVGLQSFSDTETSKLNNNNEIYEEELNVNDLTPTITSSCLQKTVAPLQCIDLTNDIGSNAYISAIVPTPDGRSIVVIASPKHSYKRCLEDCKKETVLETLHNDSESTASDHTQVESDGKKTSSKIDSSVALLFNIEVRAGNVLLEQRYSHRFSFPDIITSLFMLPLEFTREQEEEEERGNMVDKKSVPVISGEAVVVTMSGSVDIVRLNDFKTLLSLGPSGEKRFVSATYCSGVDRLCCCTDKGDLHFYALNVNKNIDDDSLAYENVSDSPSIISNAKEDTTDGIDSPVKHEMLVNEKMDTNTLLLLRELTLCENLLPKFSATLPQCWVEVQQEQQQRHHPQHLHQRGDNNQHTRSWRLTPDSSSWNEHVLEIVLPKPCCLGHIDVRFHLQQAFSIAPRIEATLLVQHINNIGSHRINRHSSATSVDDGVKFGLNGEELNDGWKDFNQVTTQSFLQRYNAEIVCGPLEIADFLDPSGQSGMVTFANSHLLKVKCKSLLIHLKALPPRDYSDKLSRTSDNFSSSKSSGQLNSDAYLKTSGHKGCDWLQEISVTIRRSRKINIPRERIQRDAMLESTNFHTHLLTTISSSENNTTVQVALDVLLWITYFNLMDHRTGIDRSCYFQLMSTHFIGLIKNCIIKGSRSMAHHCCRLFAFYLDYLRLCSETDENLLSALLQCLPNIISAKSAGAVRWYFTLLSQLSQHDPQNVAESCAKLLEPLANAFGNKCSGPSAVLCTRYGLHGHPLEAELFDMEKPSLANKSAVPGSASTYASVLTGNTTTEPMKIPDEIDLLKDLSSSEKIAGKNLVDVVSRHLYGLLEVEPLNYTCHTASEGTRLERDDLGPTMQYPTKSALPLAQLLPWQQSQFTQGKKQGSKMGDVELPKHIVKLQYLAQQQTKQYDLLPPTPKNTPFFMTPPVTPPNEALHSAVMHSLTQNSNVQPSSLGHCEVNSMWANGQLLFVAPPPQVLVIDRMHAGARRFIVLDFGRPIQLTDIIMPACNDIASLSVDIWTINEETDGERLVVASDISTSALVLSDIYPPPICRYLKVTIIARLGTTPTRSRIPMGYFYGHSIIVPDDYLLLWGRNSDNSAMPSVELLRAQVAMVTSLMEDIECRYSLSCRHLRSLMHLVPPATGLYGRLRREEEKTEEENAVVLAYQQCQVLQLQLNVALNTLRRLRLASGIEDTSSPCLVADKTLDESLRHASISRLQFLLENLLSTLIPLTTSKMTTLSPSIMASLLNPSACSLLFRHVCIMGKQHVQVMCGLLLLRVCSAKGTWGDFMGSLFNDYFAHNTLPAVPQERLFSLLVALGQKSVCSSQFVESILQLLGRHLSVLISSSVLSVAALDTTLLGWLLLFISRCLDGIVPPNLANEKENKSTPPRDRDPGRWDFMQGEAALQNNHSRNSSAKTYRRRIQKRLMHHKQHLMDVQQAKKVIEKIIPSSDYQIIDKMIPPNNPPILVNVEPPISNIANEGSSVLKSYLKQKSSKHLKDLINIRRNDFEALRRKSKDPSDSSDANSHEDEIVVVSVNKTTCVSVMKGLVAFLLAMDSSCGVDLFVIACKVVARLSGLSQPSVQLCEIATCEQLEQLIMKVCRSDSAVAWGGPWAAHAIRCLLLDIIDADRQSQSAAATPYVSSFTDDQIAASASAAAADVDEPLQIAISGSNEDDPNCNSDTTTGAEDGEEMEAEVKPYPLEKDMLMDMLLNPDDDDLMSGPPPPLPGGGTKYLKMFKDVNQFPHLLYNAGPLSAGIGAISGAGIMNWTLDSVGGEYPELGKPPVPPVRPSKANTGSSKGKPFGVGASVSSAMDARLDLRVDHLAHVRLRAMICDVITMLQSSVALSVSSSVDFIPQSTAVNNTADSAWTPRNSACDMLGTTFQRLFAMLPKGQLSLESVLRLWLAVSNSNGTQPNSSLYLEKTVVSQLLTALASAKAMTVKVWSLAFQCLSALTGHRMVAINRQERSFAVIMVMDPNLKAVLRRFLTMSLRSEFTQVGPTLSALFQTFLSKLQSHSSEVADSNLRELLLHLLVELLQERDGVSFLFGPFDALHKFLEFLLTLNYSSDIDVSLLQDTVFTIVHVINNAVLDHDGVQLRMAAHPFSGSKTVLSSLFPGLIKSDTKNSGPGDVTRDQVLTTLVMLAEKLVQNMIHPTRNISQPRGSVKVSDFQAQCSNTGMWAATQNLRETEITDDSLIGETDEHKHETASLRSERKSRKPCAHFRDASRPEQEQRENTLVDDLLRSKPLFMHKLLHSISLSSVSTISLLFNYSKQGQTSHINLEPQTFGDALFQLLCTINKGVSDVLPLVQALFDCVNDGLLCQCNVDEGPTSAGLQAAKTILDCTFTIKAFLDLGGVALVCEKFVISSGSCVSQHASFISRMLHSLSLSGVSNDKTKTLDCDVPPGLTNFAPLGTISSSNTLASPADVLIQPTAPHRRARSAAWTYHFCDDAWIDLTISLPCAVLVKEIQLVPHVTSLATCPMAISLEVKNGSYSSSETGLGNVPIIAPQITSGLTAIKFQLTSPEVATSVTIRLHKPRDSNTLGLSQILILGTLAFSDQNVANSETTYESPINENVSWLSLLHHCMASTGDGPVGTDVTLHASRIPNILVSCFSLLMSSATSSFLAQKTEDVLLRLAVSSVEIGTIALQLLLYNLESKIFLDNHLPTLILHRLGHFTSQSTVELLFQLGTIKDDHSFNRISVMLRWLFICAKNAVESISHGIVDSIPAAHIHVVAVVLWHWKQTPLVNNIRSLLTLQDFRYICNWAERSAVSDPVTHRALHWVACSMCMLQPSLFSSLLNGIGISMTLEAADLSATDDDKHFCQQQSEPMTDDLKAGSTTNCQEVQEITASQLSLLSIASQSAETQVYLTKSGLLERLCRALRDYCNSLLKQNNINTAYIDENVEYSSTENGTTNGRRHFILDANLTVHVLNFLAEVSQMACCKIELGSTECSFCWPIILCALAKVPRFGNGKEPLSLEHQQEIESAVIKFFKTVTCGNEQNQIRLANVLCNVLKLHGSSESGGISSMVIGSFLRRFILEVLLEEEKVQLCIFTPHSKLSSVPNNSFSAVLPHPQFGTGHRRRILSVNTTSTCADITNKLTESLGGLPGRISNLCSEDKERSVAEIGLDLIQQMSENAGLKTKDKKFKIKDTSRFSGIGKKPLDAQYDDAGMPIPMLALYHSSYEDAALSPILTLAELISTVCPPSTGHLVLELTAQVADRPLRRGGVATDSNLQNNLDGLLEEPRESVSYSLGDSLLLTLANKGGLALLAEHLPLLYPAVTNVLVASGGAKKDISTPNNNTNPADYWVNLESMEDIYEEIYEPVSFTAPTATTNRPRTLLQPVVPPHSLLAFSLFLRLPGYAEMLIRGDSKIAQLVHLQEKRAKYLLRLALGVTDDGEGGHVLLSKLAADLPTLPFTVLKTLFDATPLTTDDGLVLRHKALDSGVIHLLLGCLSVLSHHAPRAELPGVQHEVALAASQAAAMMVYTTMCSSSSGPSSRPSGSGLQVGLTGLQQSSATASQDDRNQQYWAKGTGFGTGSTVSTFNTEQVLLKQKIEEEHITCMLEALAAYIRCEQDDAEKMPPQGIADLLTASCLVPMTSSYLRNDSVLDMAKHVPLYVSLLELLRTIAHCRSLVSLLLLLERDDDPNASIVSLLDKMRQCVDTYSNHLKSNQKSQTKAEEDEAEGLAKLIPNIQKTAEIVKQVTGSMKKTEKSRNKDESGGAQSAGDLSFEEMYMNVMKVLQFGTFTFVTEDNNQLKFTTPYHFENIVRSAGSVTLPSRARRLAQEVVTLSTSLPLSASSSVFVRCDEEHLDVMKVMITGPSDTPYANGCFEFDVYFPQDYPNSPPAVNLETTGNHTVRFNPNLYNDGKVCLSILNTWHGRPEEKWNAHTCSFLQVLVSIQSLILVNEPYFNEPGYERSRGTAAGTASSHEYDANIRQATVRWAMLEMIRNPPPSFAEVVLRHFWLKREEITTQIEGWIADMESGSKDKRVGRSIAHSCLALQRHYAQLKEEFSKMKPPLDLISSPTDANDCSSDCSASNVDNTASHCETSLSYELPVITTVLSNSDVSDQFEQHDTIL